MISSQHHFDPYHKTVSTASATRQTNDSSLPLRSRSSTSAVIPPQNVSLDPLLPIKLKLDWFFFLYSCLYLGTEAERESTAALWPELVSHVGLKGFVFQSSCVAVLIKGRQSALSGLGYEVTHRQAGEDQVGSGFFPSIFSNIVFDQTNQESPEMETISHRCSPLLTLNGRFKLLCVPGTSVCHLAGIKTCTISLQYHLPVQCNMIITRFKDGIPTLCGD